MAATASAGRRRRLRRGRADRGVRRVERRAGDVTLYEADDRLGGHADTHDVDGPDGALAIDTGFIVHNERTYPTLLRMFAELGVATQDSEMSMSTRDDATGLEWAGALGAAGLFPTWANLRRPAYLRMLTEIPRFHRAARRLLAEDGDDTTLREFLDTHGFTAYFARHFMEPVVAAVWSCDPAVALDYPARYLFSFLDHHGMLGVFGSPEWKTVAGGSRSYVDRVGALLDDVRLGTKVTSVLETAHGVEVVDGNGRAETYDAVVIATHPDQALSMLAEPTPTQREVLSAAAVLRQPGAAAHRRVAAAAGPQGPRLVELPPRRRRPRPGDGHLRPDPADAAADRDPLPGHPRRRGPRRPGDGDRPPRVRPPALHARVRGRPGPAPRVRHRPDRLRRRLPRLGVPRGRCAFGAGRG